MKQLSDVFRKSLVATVAISLVMGVTVLICELGFRTLLFSEVAFMERFREPGLYTDLFYEEDWWKLYHAFHKPKNDTGKHPHPLLGWSSKLFNEAYLHDEAGQVGRRRPVLFFGDSFTHCVIPAEECFQGILNRDEEFSRTHHLLNYGVLGYGVDQIYLLLKNSLPHYSDPYVVVGVYTRDLDRSILSYFVAQKPYFELTDGELTLRGTPIIQDHSAYLSNNPPQIWSYLYRLWLYQETRPWRLKQYLRRTDDKRAIKERINEKIVVEMRSELDSQDLSRLFVIFTPKEEIMKMGWHEQYLFELFRRHKVPYISTRVLIRDDMERTGLNIDAYYVQEGHPNAYQNLVVSKELKRRIVREQGARVN